MLRNRNQAQEAEDETGEAEEVQNQVRMQKNEKVTCEKAVEPQALETVKHNNQEEMSKRQAARTTIPEETTESERTEQEWKECLVKESK